MLCVICPGTNMGKKELMCFYSDLIAVTLTANYTTNNFMALLYRKGLGGKEFCIKLEALIISSSSWTWTVPSLTLRRERKGEKDTTRDNLSSSALETVPSFCASDGNVYRIHSSNAWRSEEMACWGRNFCFVCNWKSGGALRHPIGLGFECLSTWAE